MATAGQEPCKDRPCAPCLGFPLLFTVALGMAKGPSNLVLHR